MSNTDAKTPLIEHAPPKPFPEASLVGLAVPNDFNAVIIAAASKNGVTYQEQFMTWAIKGAEHERLCEPKLNKAGRTNRK